MRIYFISAIIIAGFIFAACGGSGASKQKTDAEVPEVVAINTLTDAEIADGWKLLFDGKTFDGWRGYNRTDMPTAWIIEDDAIKIQGSGRGEAGAKDGGDIIFDEKFKNFELQFDWKVAEGANSGVFYYIQEIEGQPAYISAPEYQILDNENHPDGTLGIDGNRASASLYDMIPAKPQNAKPYGEWNTGAIKINKGSVYHYQNEELVVEYHLWTPKWQEMLDDSKFSKEKWPLAYDLLLNCGGDEGNGYIGFQDHGDDVWFRNIKIKILE
ncbi:MAG: DUF1080 domain-containing protein [Marinilabiliaceae bacterium]|nr:DUF1080 domain-containing protein [Marinilabiliaceae bacterium]